MANWILKFAAAAALLLCVLTIWLWVRSEFTRDAYPNMVREPAISIQSARARAHICIIDAAKGGWPTFEGEPCPFQGGADTGDPLPTIWESERQTSNRIPIYSYRLIVPDARLSNGFGFTVTHDSIGGRNRRGWQITTISIPYWAILLLLLILPTRQTMLWLRTRRWRQAGRCPVCGYDLRATPDRCPECGTPVRAPVGKPAKT